MARADTMLIWVGMAIVTAMASVFLVLWLFK
jgi:hypothetical protein